MRQLDSALSSFNKWHKQDIPLSGLSHYLQAKNGIFVFRKRGGMMDFGVLRFADLY